MARPRDELAARVEEPLELRGHRVEGARELGELARARLVGARGEVAGRERASRRRAAAGSRLRSSAASEQRGADRDGRRRRRDGEDLHVVAHVEHRPAGEEDGGERQRHGEQREAGELQRARSASSAERERDARRRPTSVADGDDDGELDHGTNR